MPTSIAPAREAIAERAAAAHTGLSNWMEALTMLDLRPNCECCDTDLPGESPDALICSFECTFCRACNERHFHGRCPNCGGQLVARPTRVGKVLANNPASTHRVLKPKVPCA